jgi:hypothetical protein
MDPRGHVLRTLAGWGEENSTLTLEDESFGARRGNRAQQRLGIQLLPLGLPNGDLDLELHLILDRTPLAPLQGLHVTPGTPIELEVPGEPLRIEIRAVRGEPGRPLVS